MPTTLTELPILTHFLCVVRATSEMQDTPSSQVDTEDKTPKKLPKGVVLGPDGKPCRSCTSVASWMAMTKAQNPTSTSIQKPPPSDCPADVEQLGRSTWTMLHTMTANYPTAPSLVQQQQTRSFLNIFSHMYPCSHCASDFRQWMSENGNTPRVSNRDEFGRWMCEAHNAVNEKLGKSRFDCNKWEERWRTGPADGRCG